MNILYLKSANEEVLAWLKIISILPIKGESIPEAPESKLAFEIALTNGMRQKWFYVSFEPKPLKVCKFTCCVLRTLPELF